MFDLAATLDRLKKGANRQHLLPYSTLIVAMGDHWLPGCKESVMAVREYSRQAGSIEVEILEEKDRCYGWGDALGSMRNMGYRHAIEGGFERLLYVDNDIILEKHTLLQLLSRHMPIIAPRVTYLDGLAHGLETPKLQADAGLVLAGSVVLSCILFKTSIFYDYATHDFWGNSLGDDEEYHFTKLALRGLMPFVDTDVTAVCQAPPHFPLDQKRPKAEVDGARAERYKTKILLLPS